MHKFASATFEGADMGGAVTESTHSLDGFALFKATDLFGEYHSVTIVLAL